MEILIVAYLILSLSAALVIWAALIASKQRTDEVQNTTVESFRIDRFFRRKAEKSELDSR